MTLTRVPPAEALRLMKDEGYVYLDVRTPEEFELGHPSHALNVPLQLTAADGKRTANPQFLEVATRALRGKKGVVIGCQSGKRSLAATEQLLAAGVVTDTPEAGRIHAVDQRAGFGGVRDGFGKLVEAGWQGAGLPVSYEPEAGKSYRELSEKQD